MRKSALLLLHVRSDSGYFPPRSPGSPSCHWAQPGLPLYGTMRLANFLLRRHPSLLLQPVRDPGYRGKASTQRQRETAPNAVVSTDEWSDEDECK